MQEKTLTAYEWEEVRRRLRNVEGYKSILVRDRISIATRTKAADEAVTVRFTDSQGDWLDANVSEFWPI